jgi:hypothetical protein
MNCPRVGAAGYSTILSPSERFFGCKIRAGFLILGSLESDLAMSALARGIQKRKMKMKSQSTSVKWCPLIAGDLALIQS